MSIRVVYQFEVSLEDTERFVRAWHQIVEAHSGHGALGSTLLRHEDEPTRWCAISHWVDRQTWLDNRRDDAAPEAYAVFRQCVDVISKDVFTQWAAVNV